MTMQRVLRQGALFLATSAAIAHAQSSAPTRPRLLQLATLPTAPLFTVVDPSFDVWVDTLGRPDSIRVHKVGDGQAFADAIGAAIRKFKYAPAMRDGRAVRAGFRLEVRFEQIIEADTTPGELTWRYAQDSNVDVIVGSWRALPPPAPFGAEEKRAIIGAAVKGTGASLRTDTTIALKCWISADVADHPASAPDVMQYCHTDMQRHSPGAVSLGAVKRLNEFDAWVYVSVLTAPREGTSGPCRLHKSDGVWSGECVFLTWWGSVSGHPFANERGR
jgi:hypothetical protein